MVGGYKFGVPYDGSIKLYFTYHCFIYIYIYIHSAATKLNPIHNFITVMQNTIGVCLLSNFVIYTLSFIRIFGRDHASESFKYSKYCIIKIFPTLLFISTMNQSTKNLENLLNCKFEPFFGGRGVL